MRIVTDEKDRQAYKEFLEKHERCNFQQSPEWAKVKGNWINEIVLAEDESGKIIGAVSILIRKIPIFGNIMYSSRGPTCDIHDISVMKQLTDGIKELAKKYKAIVYKAEPDILSSDEEYRKIVTSLGYKIKDDAKNFREEIQPRYVFRLDIKNNSKIEIIYNANIKSMHEENNKLSGISLDNGTDLKVKGVFIYIGYRPATEFVPKEILDENGYGFYEADTTYGKIGVKVWIYKGEVLPAKKEAKGGNE